MVQKKTQQLYNAEWDYCSAVSLKEGCIMIRSFRHWPFYYQGGLSWKKINVPNFEKKSFNTFKKFKIMVFLKAAFPINILIWLAAEVEIKNLFAYQKKISYNVSDIRSQAPSDWKWLVSKRIYFAWTFNEI